MGCGCEGDQRATGAAADLRSSPVRYIGQATGGLSVRGHAGTVYEFSTGDSVRLVYAADVDLFAADPDFVVRRLPAQPASATATR